MADHELNFSYGAEILSEAMGMDPDGMITTFLSDGPRSRTGRDAHRGPLWAAIQFVRDQLQIQAETLPIEDYGTIRPAVEWLDRQLQREGNP